MRASAATTTRLILEKLGELGTATFESFFPKKYAYTRISRPLFGLDAYPRVSPPTLSTLLSRLQRQGLVLRKGTHRSSSWVLTRKGKHRLQKSDKPYRADIPESDGIIRLVIFDIPERERKKRDILRAELVGCDFTVLQKSVWMGRHPLPKSFIAFLDSLNLKNRVHIFSVKDCGTLDL